MAIMVDENDDDAYIAFLEEQIYLLRQSLGRAERNIVGLESDLEQAEAASARAFLLLAAGTGAGNPLQPELPGVGPLDLLARGTLGP